MKKTLLSFMTLVFFVCSFLANAQTPLQVCKLKAKFDFKTERCFVSFTDFSATATGTTITSWHWDFGDATTSALQNPTHTYATAGTYTVCLTIIGVNPATGLKCKDQFCAPVTVQGCGQTLPCKLAAKFDFKSDGCKAGFADLSATAPGTTIISWFWDFGDATTSILQNPTHVYTSSGVFNVCLTIVGVNAAGVKCTDKVCQQITIKGCGQTEPCKLAAKFTFKTDKCNAYFADLSAVGAGTTITNWYWDFGDATTSTLQNPTHTYAAPGTYTVCLIIVGNGGGTQCKDKFCLPVTVEGCGQTEPCNVYPKFDFKASKCTVSFMDYSAAGAGTTITNWYWDFGDATTSTLQNPTHTYAAPGTYTVCLTIVGVNAAGVKCKNQYCQQITVEGCGQVLPCGVKPIFEFKVDKCTVYFTDYSGTNPGTTITNWYWDFGDGNTSNLQHPTHVYAANGTYTVCLTTYAKNTDGDECKNTYCFPVKVDGCGDVQPCGVKPLFDFKIDKCTVYFVDNSGTNSGSTITSWYWDFGDGNTSNLQNPVHTYATAGTYTVCLTAYAVNAAGVECKNTYCLKVTVEGCGQVEPCKLAAKFDYKVEKCTVYFTDYSGAGAGTSITNWYWDFGDGNTSALQNPTHVYATPGNYLVCLVIVGANAAGEQCKDRLCLEVKVDGCGQTEPCKVAAKFDYKVDKCAVYFTDYSATTPGTNITYWEWSFGDGGVSYVQNPTHVYTAPGTYVVCLIIVGTNPLTGEQCKDKVCLEVTVKECDQTSACIVYPKFDFKADKCTVYFTDYSGTGSGTILTNWYWEFGDGSTSTLQNPVHTYAAAGTYEVCLIVVGKNAAGIECKDRICLKVTVDCPKQGMIDRSSISSLQVYPNPAQDVVNIQFKLDVAGQVNISITDIQGRVLSVVQNGNMNAGIHKFNWNVNVRSGLYFVTIKTDAGIEQKQLIIQE